MNVLVTDGNYKHSLGIIRALGLEGFNIYVLSNIPNCVGSFSKFCRKHLLLRFNRISEVDPTVLLSLVQDCKIDVLIPVSAESFKYFDHYREFFSNRVAIALPPTSALNVALSKELTYKTLGSIGIRVPMTFYPDRLEDVRNFAINSFGKKVVIKGRYETGHSIVDYVEDQSALFIKFKNLCTKYDLGENELPIIQEYIAGEGQGFFAAYNKGVCGPTFQHRRLLEYPITGGASLAAEAIKSEDLNFLGRKVLDHLGWHGVAMVEFKRTASNELVLMEINPKFWGSLDLAIASGVNFPLAYSKIALDNEGLISTDYHVGTKFHWPFPGYVQLLMKYPQCITVMLKNLFSSSMRSNIWLKKDVQGTMGIFINPILRQMRKIVS